MLQVYQILINFILLQFAKQKQAQLEDYKGSEFEGSDDPEKKKKIIEVRTEILITIMQSASLCTLHCTIHCTIYKL